jgi:EAL domain-containing protein (putative c-di-GMP-specific phosphodiesterase class I)
MSTLKLDMSYVRTLPTVMENRVFVRGIAEICRGYGVRTVAEGVETMEILTILRELGVDRAQGYQIGRPSPDLPHSPGRDRPASGAFPPVPA